MLKIVRDESGNKLILEVITEGKRLTLINIYGPNRDDPGFYEEMTNNVKYSENLIIIVGDFNMVLDPDVDCKDYINISNPMALEQILNLMIKSNLKDSWRELNQEAREYTWRRKSSTKQARLDFFLISESIFMSVMF